MKRPSAEQRELVLQWIERWRPRLFLGEYRIELKFHTRPCKEADNDDITFAQTVARFAGLDIDIHIYPEFWTETTEVRERIILHEMLHAVATSMDESDTTTLTEIMWKAYRPLDSAAGAAVVS